MGEEVPGGQEDSFLHPQLDFCILVHVWLGHWLDEMFETSILKFLLEMEPRLKEKKKLPSNYGLRHHRHHLRRDKYSNYGHEIFSDDLGGGMTDGDDGWVAGCGGCGGGAGGNGGGCGGCGGGGGCDRIYFLLN